MIVAFLSRFVLAGSVVGRFFLVILAGFLFSHVAVATAAAVSAAAAVVLTVLCLIVSRFVGRFLFIY